MSEIERGGVGLNSSGVTINPATEEKQDVVIAGLSGISGLSGAGTDTTLTLTLATTAYACPAATPASAYSLTISNVSDTTVYFRFTTGTTGGIPIASNQILTVKFAANIGGFLYCGSAGKIVNIDHKIL